ncbi:citrate synthase-like protein [Lipomyces japonicus]|uniref:citrate synthase-like protein n=1 Tax=Lipomyces japonicus TaxID=56871 RepID=UPI0034CFB78F
MPGLVAAAFSLVRPCLSAHGRRYSSSALKTALQTVIPEKRALLQQVKFERANASLGDDKVANLLGGMRGLQSILWEGSVLDPNNGIRFHGTSIRQCLKLLPTASPGGQILPEAMFWFLLTGKVPTAEQTRQLSADLALQADLPDYVTRLLDSLPRSLHPMTQLAIAVAALNHDSKFSRLYATGMPKSEYWESTFDDVITLIAKLPALAAKIYHNIYNYATSDSLPHVIDRSADWALNYANLLGMHNANFVDFLRLYCSIHADHEGGNVSAHATHLVGSALSDSFLSYSAGLQGLAGPLHGLAAQEVLRFVLQMQKSIPQHPSNDDIAAYLWATLNSGRVIPGYGHAVLRRPDPRFEVLMEYALAKPDIFGDDLFQLVLQISHVAPEVLISHGKTANPYPNVDSLSGVLLYHFGIRETSYYTVVFGVARSMGPLAQLIWDRVLGLPIERPKSLSLQKIIELTSIN